MVNFETGEWTEEKDYSKFPRKNWCLYDYVAVLIREENNYEPRTTMENLINNIFIGVDKATEHWADIVEHDPMDIICWVKDSGGFGKFDYYA